MKRILLLIVLTITIFSASAQTTIKPPGVVSIGTSYFKNNTTDSVYMYIPGVPGKYYNIGVYGKIKALLDLKANLTQTAYKATIAEVRAFTGAARFGLVTISDVDKTGNFYYDPSDTSTPDNLGTVLVTADGKRYKRPINGPVEACWFGISGNNTEQGANTVNMLATVADNTTIRFKPYEKYIISTPLSIVGKNITLDFNSSTLIKNTSSTLLTYEGGVDWTASVSISKVSELLDGSTSTTECLKIDFTDIPTGLKVGDVLKLTSEDMIYGSKPVEGDGKYARMGQFMVIGKIDVANKSVYTTSVPEELDKYTLNIKAHKLANKAIHIKSLNLETSALANTNNWVSAHIVISNSRSSSFKDIKSIEAYGPTIEGRGMYNPIVDNLFIDIAYTNEAIDRVGYGFRDMGCQYGQFNVLTGIKLRHLYTTNQSYLGPENLNTIASYGRSMFSTISNSVGHGCDNGAFDTHDGAWKTVFNNCSAFGNYAGNASTGAGFTVRGHFITLNNCYSTSGRIGATISEQYPNGTEGIVLNNCDFSGSSRALNTGVANGGTRVDIQVNGGYLESKTQDLNTLVNTDITLKGVKLRAGDNLFARYLAGTNSNLDVYDCDLINESTSTQMRVIFLEGNTTNITVRKSRLNFKKTIDRLVFANNRTGSVVLEDLESNQNITEVSNTIGSLSYFKYNIKYNVNESRSSTALFTQNLDVSPKISTINLIDPIITVLVSGSTQGILLSDLDPGNSVGQRLVIKNNTTLFYFFLQNTTLVKTVSGTNYLLRPDTEVSLIWNGTNWKEDRKSYTVSIQKVSADANALISASTETLILDATLTADRVLTMRNPVDYANQRQTIIVRNASAFHWRVSPTVIGSGGSSLVQLKNASSYTFISNGTSWIQENADFGLNMFSAAGVNYTLSSTNSYIKLPLVTVENRILALPPAAANEGKPVLIENNNNAVNYDWVFESGVVFNVSGASVTIIPKTSVILLYSNGTNYILWTNSTGGDISSTWTLTGGIISNNSARVKITATDNTNAALEVTNTTGDIARFINNGGVVNVAATQAGPMNYGQNFAGSYTARSMVDKAYVDSKVSSTTIYTASGNGVNATITIPHGYTGVTSASGVNVQARNASSAGITYATIDATNIYIFYSVAPASGTSNLAYSIIISPTTFNPF